MEMAEPNDYRKALGIVRKNPNYQLIAADLNRK